MAVAAIDGAADAMVTTLAEGDDDFVTVLNVNESAAQPDSDEQRPQRRSSAGSFVTVVALDERDVGEDKDGSANHVEEVVMYRLPGERLGMGLKFEGGMQAAECVSHVYIQSVATDSPARRTPTAWGGLVEGDEILQIDGRDVNEMTRVDCVTTLKKAPVAIKMLIFHGEAARRGSGLSTSGEEDQPDAITAAAGGNHRKQSHLPSTAGKQLPEVPSAPPPPIPPRKTRGGAAGKQRGRHGASRKDGGGGGATLQEPRATAAKKMGGGNASVGLLGLRLPGWEELMLRRCCEASAGFGAELGMDLLLSSASDTDPAAADVYDDLIAEDDARSRQLINEYESDDTASSASTVVERPNAAATSGGHRGPLSADDLLGPFEQLEKEIEANFHFGSVRFAMRDEHRDEDNVAESYAHDAIRRRSSGGFDTLDEEDENGEMQEGLLTSEDALPAYNNLQLEVDDCRHTTTTTAEKGLQTTLDEDEEIQTYSEVTPETVVTSPEVVVASHDVATVSSEMLISATVGVEGGQCEVPTPCLPGKRQLDVPPPVPPRKLKNRRRSSVNGSPSSVTVNPLIRSLSAPDSFLSDAEPGVLFDDAAGSGHAMDFPLVGSLLQEMEQHFGEYRQFFSQLSPAKVTDNGDSDPTLDDDRDPSPSGTADPTEVPLVVADDRRCWESPVDGASVDSASAAKLVSSAAPPPPTSVVPPTAKRRTLLLASPTAAGAPSIRHDEKGTSDVDVDCRAQTVHGERQADGLQWLPPTAAPRIVDSLAITTTDGFNRSNESKENEKSSVVETLTSATVQFKKSSNGVVEQPSSGKETSDSEHVEGLVADVICGVGDAGQVTVAEKSSLSPASSTCEVVAVLEKSTAGTQLSPPRHESSGVDLNFEGKLEAGMESGVGTLLDFTEDGDDIFPPFSRLPPDGHEFPPNYLELSSTLGPASNDIAALLMMAESDKRGISGYGHRGQLIETPYDFDNNFSHFAEESATGSAAESGEPPSFVSIYQFKNENASDNTLLSSSRRSSDASHDSQPASFELHSSEPSEREVCDLESSLTDLAKTMPPTPSKRRAFNNPPPPGTVERTTAGKQPEKSLSVRDKIAMFTAKTDSSPAASKSRPPVPTKPTAVPLPEPNNQHNVPNECGDSATDPTVSKHQETPVRREVVPPATNGRFKPAAAVVVPRKEQHHVTTATVAPQNSYLLNFTDYDRPGSSLSLSSNFSKSSDDLLSQDMDSSDMDDHVGSVDRRGHVYGKVASESYFKRYAPLGTNGGSTGKNSWSTSSTDSDAANDSRVRPPAGAPSHKSMYAILESRKTNVSKLKGLVIPSMHEKSMNPYSPANDLPLIFSVDSILLSKVELPPKSTEPAGGKLSNDAPDSPAAKHVASKGFPASVLPANSLDQSNYSPAFRRKPFLHRAADHEGEKTAKQLASNPNGYSDHPSVKLPETEQPPRAAVTSSWLDGAPPPPLPKSLPPDNKVKSTGAPPPSHRNGFTDLPDVVSGVPAEFDRHGDTEDQESGISSIESPNVSIHNTPPGSPKELHHLRQTSSYGLSDGVRDRYSPPRKMSLPSKSSVWESIPTPNKSRDCSDDPDDEDEYGEGEGDEEYDEGCTNPRVLKANSVEAINRMNVLHSSKKRSGGGAHGANRDSADRSSSGDDSSSNASNHSDSPSPSHRPHHHHRRQMSFDDKVILCKSESTATTSPTAVKSFSQPLSHQRRASNDNILGVSLSSRVEPVAVTVAVTVEKKAVSDERWLELERKYGPKVAAVPDNGSSTPSREVTPEYESKPIATPATVGKTDGSALPAAGVVVGKNFHVLARQWEQISVDGTNGTASISKTPPSLSKSMPSIVQKGLRRPSVELATATTTAPDSGVVESASGDRKMSLPSTVPVSRYAAGVNMRDKRSSAQMSRPTSLIENETRLRDVATFELSSKVGRGPAEPVKSRAVQLQEAIQGQPGRRATSFNDLRQIFENQEMSIAAAAPASTTSAGEHLLGPREIANHIRMSSLDSTTSDSDFIAPVHYGSTNSLGSNAFDQYGSITSLASSTSLISPQELQQLIDEANQSLEESGTPSHEISVIVLQREIPGGSIGITLTGGADYDSKEITVNKVIIGSLADRDGRIQKGDRVLSINGKNLKGVTHREALSILKAPRTDCVLVLSRSRQNTPQDVREIGVSFSRLGNGTALRNGGIKFPLSPIANGPTSSPVKISDAESAKSLPTGSRVTTQIEKNAGGLGFSLDGGKDSPLGDKPLTIKKIFIGGPADKDGSLHVGDEVLSVNGCDVTNMARIEAWTFMRKLPDGLVTLVVNHQA